MNWEVSWVWSQWLKQENKAEEIQFKNNDRSSKWFQKYYMSKPENLQILSP